MPSRFIAATGLIWLLLLSAPPAAWAQAPATTPTAAAPATRPAAEAAATRSAATAAGPAAAPPAAGHPAETAPGVKAPELRFTRLSPTTVRVEEAAAGHGQGQTAAPGHGAGQLDYMSMVFVFMLATFIGVGVILRVSRLLHTPLMSLTNAISAIAVVGSLIVTGDPRYPTGIRIMGAIALFASMTNIVSGFLITDRMLKMFRTRQPGREGGER